VPEADVFLFLLFSFAPELNTKQERLDAARVLVSMMPEAHRDTAHYLLTFLKKVSTFSKNKMHVKNLAVVFAPTLFGKS